jgi:putative phage-type endonuclease
MLDPRRKGAITASEIGAIAGNGRFATRADVMRRKVREANGLPSEFVGNVATQWGNDNEARAIAEYEFCYGCKVEFDGENQKFVDVTLEYDGVEFRAGCTPDGIVNGNTLIEVKCPYGIRKEEPDAVAYLAKAPEYMDQMQWQMLCTDISNCVFLVWTPEGTDTKYVESDVEHQQRLIVAAAEFQKELDAILDDPELQKPYLTDKKSKKDDAIERSDAEYATAAELYRTTQAVLVEAQAANEAAKQALIDITEGLNVKGCGVSIIHSTRAGSVDYKIIPVLKGLDLTPFRKPDTATVTVKVES